MPTPAGTAWRTLARLQPERAKNVELDLRYARGRMSLAAT